MSDASGKYGKPFGHSSDRHWMFEHRTEAKGGLSVNPQSSSKVDNGQKRIFIRINTDMVYSEIAQNRSAGAGTPPKIQCHRNETLLQLRERGVYELRSPKRRTGAGAAKKI